MEDIHVVLVLEVEKYPELYNYTLAEYSRKDVTETAWAKVANKTNLPVNECKEKWRNIRSSFIRSLKPSSGANPKKPYYLTEYLSFVLPFMKPVNKSQTPGNMGMLPTAESDPLTDDAEAEVSQAVDAEEEQFIAAANENEHIVIEPEVIYTQEESSSQTGGKRRRKNNSNLDNAILTYLKKKADTMTSNINQSKMNHFFLSIINEFDNMTDQEIRKFKIKTLELIDDIKQGRQSSPPVSLPSTSAEL